MASIIPFFSLLVCMVFWFSFMQYVLFRCIVSWCVSLIVVFMCSVCPFFIVIVLSVSVVLILCMLNFFVASSRL